MPFTRVVHALRPNLLHQTRQLYTSSPRACRSYLRAAYTRTVRLWSLHCASSLRSSLAVRAVTHLPFVALTDLCETVGAPLKLRQQGADLILHNLSVELPPVRPLVHTSRSLLLTSLSASRNHCYGASAAAC